MRIITIATILALSSCVVAETNTIAQTNAPSAKRHKRTPEEIRERAATYIDRRHGGYIRRAGSAYGKVVFLNAQKRVSNDALKPAFKEIDINIHPIWTLENVDSVNLVNPRADIAKHGGNIGVVLAESADLPMLVTAPEDGWAIVNVTALAKGETDTKKVESRVRKELLRAFALTGGCAFMARGAIVLSGTVRTAKDLDQIPEESYGVDALNTLGQHLPNYGIMPWYQTTYKKACREGWAPLPTNEYQKAIWDKIHALPTEPIKILPETKKVTE